MTKVIRTLIVMLAAATPNGLTHVAIGESRFLETHQFTPSLILQLELTFVRASSLQPPDSLREVGVGLGGTFVYRGFRLSGLLAGALDRVISAAANYRIVLACAQVNSRETLTYLSPITVWYYA
jgi:hypothetical protein